MLNSATLSPVQGSAANGSARRPALASDGREAGLGHLQGREDALGEERAERFAADDLDDAAEDVGGAAVVELVAGMADQREARHQRGVLGIGDLAAADAGLLVELVHGTVALVLVGEARSVAEQVLHRHRPLGRNQLQLAAADHADLLAGELRNELGNRVAEQQVTVLDQRHDADRHDRLGHREYPEDRIVRHRRGARRALLAHRLEPADLAAPRHQHGDAGNGSLVDLALEGVRHGLEAGPRQARAFRGGPRAKAGSAARSWPAGRLERSLWRSRALPVALDYRERTAGPKPRDKQAKPARFTLANRPPPVLESGPDPQGDAGSVGV